MTHVIIEMAARDVKQMGHVITQSSLKAGDTVIFRGPGGNSIRIEVLKNKEFIRTIAPTYWERLGHTMLIALEEFCK